MNSDSFRSSNAAMRIRSISSDSGSQIVTREVFFSAMATQNKKARAEALVKTTDPKGGRIRRGDTDKARISSSLLGWGVAQVGPIDIGAQVFAAYCAVGGAIDDWAMFGWQTFASDPVMDNLWGYTNRPSQSSLASNDFNGSKKCFHSYRLNTWGGVVNAWCLND